MSHSNREPVCYIFTMSGRIVPTVLWAIMAALVMLSAAPAAVQVSPGMMMGDGSVDQGAAVGMASAHESSAHKPCTSPDCTPESDCPANMSMSDCNECAISCSLSGTTVLTHRVGEIWVQRGVTVVIQDPPNLILTNHSTSIFHPPRLVS